MPGKDCLTKNKDDMIVNEISLVIQNIISFFQSPLESGCEKIDIKIHILYDRGERHKRIQPVMSVHGNLLPHKASIIGVTRNESCDPLKIDAAVYPVC